MPRHYRQAQPQRATGSRRQSAGLVRSQAGTGPFPHLQNARRQAMKRKRKRKPKARHDSPLKRVLRTRQKLG